jgi:hypothetical protein
VDNRDTIRRIKAAVAGGSIPSVFRPADVNKALKIHWAGTFLPKHRVGNPGVKRALMNPDLGLLSFAKNSGVDRLTLDDSHFLR